MSTTDLVERLLAQDRAASEIEDAVPAAPAIPLPLLTDEQCAATDDMAGLTQELTAAGISKQASRVEFLRKQRADLQHYVDNPLQSTDGRSRRARVNRKTRENLDRVDAILRDLAGFLIAGTYSGDLA